MTFPPVTYADLTSDAAIVACLLAFGANGSDPDPAPPTASSRANGRVRRGNVRLGEYELGFLAPLPAAEWNRFAPDAVAPGSAVWEEAEGDGPVPRAARNTAIHWTAKEDAVLDTALALTPGSWVRAAEYMTEALGKRYTFAQVRNRQYRRKCAWRAIACGRFHNRCSKCRQPAMGHARCEAMDAPPVSEK